MDEKIVLLSIIIPVFNTSKFLSECLDSIIFQNLSYEIIIVNDGSTDCSKYIILKYSNKYSFIRYYETNNNGLSAARNLGMMLSKGKYIGFLDSDDFFINDSFLVLYNRVRNLNVDVVFLNSKLFDNNSGLYSDFFDNEYYNYLSNSYNFRNKLAYLEPAAWKKVYRREFINNYKFYEGMIFEDLPFHFDIIDNYEDICFCKKVYIAYRINRDGQITHKSNNKYFDLFRIFEKIINKKYKHIDTLIIYNIYKRYIYWLMTKEIILDKKFSREFELFNKKFFNLSFLLSNRRSISLRDVYNYLKIRLLRFNVIVLLIRLFL